MMYLQHEIYHLNRFQLMVTTDGPKKSMSAGGDSFFNRFSISGSRRNSAISSITSIDKFGLAEFDSSVRFFTIVSQKAEKEWQPK